MTLEVGERYGIGGVLRNSSAHLLIEAKEVTFEGFIDKIRDIEGLPNKCHIGIFVPEPLEEGPDVGSTVENVVKRLTRLE